MSDVTTACRDIGALTPLAQRACNLFLAECKRRGISVFITETYRSQARQDYLYQQGRSRPGSIVTWTRNSRHSGRRAWDIAVNPPLALYDSATLYVAGQAAKALGITWGGDWSTPDRPHFEITGAWQPPKEEEMTYEQFKEYMARYETEKQAEAVSDYAAESWEKAKKAGLLDGTMPRGPVERQQLACVLDRAGVLDAY